MQHMSDNPVWHALIGSYAGLAIGRGDARHYPRDIAPFSAIAEVSAAAYADFATDLSAGTEARLFRPADEATPPGWETLSSRSIIQMVAETIMPPDEASRDDAIALGADDTQDMLALAEAAKLGPFGGRATLLGR
jgi:hypothetical protein